MMRFFLLGPVLQFFFGASTISTLKKFYNSILIPLEIKAR